MIIRRISIKDFGKIHNRTLDFAPGLNILCGENESGKTTVHTFVRSMLYGIRRQKGRAAKKDAYAVYEPWENPASFGGILWFENGGKNFRLSRNFYKEHSSCELFCEDDGEILNAQAGDLDAVLGDVSEAVYENTVSIAQLKSATGQELAREVQNYMAGYQGAGDSSINLNRTIQRLKMSRKGYQVQADRRRREYLHEKEKLDSNMDYVRREIGELKEREDRLHSREKTASTDGDSAEILENRVAQLTRQKNLQLVCILLLFLAALTLTISLWRVSGSMLLYPLVSAGGGIISLLALILWRTKTLRELEKRRRQAARLKKRREKLEWSRESLEESRREKKTALTNLEAEYRETENREYLPLPEEIEVKALNLAMETIEKLSGQIHKRVGRGLGERTSEILSEITSGKYREVLLDPELRIQVNTGERMVPLEGLSRGTVEQIYFSLRMAAGELLCKEESFPVFLDEVFGMYDQERLASALRWLSEQKRQVIVTTCQNRETELLDKMGIPYHRIYL